jgi:hypothetical protein
MDLQSNDLRNSIMEEVILKNYKLLQFVEKEMNQMKDEIKLLKEENAHLKEKNKLSHDKIESLQTKIDNSGIESNILVGYKGQNNPVYCNYNFDKECKSLPQLLYSWNCKILLKLSVFRQLSTYYNFNCVNLYDLCRNDNGQLISNINFVDGLINPKPIIISSYIVYNGVALNRIKLTFPLLDKLINILNECNIKLTLGNRYDLYLDETNKINYRRITNSMINDFRGMNTGGMNDPATEKITIEQ